MINSDLILLAEGKNSLIMRDSKRHQNSLNSRGKDCIPGVQIIMLLMNASQEQALCYVPLHFKTTHFNTIVYKPVYAWLLRFFFLFLFEPNSSILNINEHRPNVVHFNHLIWLTVSISVSIFVWLHNFSRCNTGFVAPSLIRPCSAGSGTRGFFCVQSCWYYKKCHDCTDWIW